MTWRVQPGNVRARGVRRSRDVALFAIVAFEPAETIASSAAASTMAPLPDRKTLESMKRTDLQRLCKVRGIAHGFHSPETYQAPRITV